MLTPPNRAVGLLFAAVAGAAIAQFAAITVGAIVAVDAAGSRAFTGAPAASAIIGTSLGTLLLGSVMERRGRRWGLIAGWLAGAVGALVAAGATEYMHFAWLLAGMVLIGLGTGASQLARYAAAETVEPSLRGRAISWVVWAAAVGAVAGPLSLGPAGRIGQGLGFGPDAGGFLVAAAGLAAAIGVASVLPASLRRRPALQTGADATTPSDGAPAVTARVTPRAWRFLAALALGQAAMVMVMTITPVHLADGGHAYGVIGTVMSGHFVGMFALSPLVGWAVDRVGSRWGTSLGLAVLALGSALAAWLPIEHGSLLSGPLLLTGLGWCLTFVAASKVMAVELEGAGRARLQGRVDAMVWLTSATASFSSGLIFAATGYAQVGTWVAAACALATGVGAVGIARAGGPRATQ